MKVKRCELTHAVRMFFVLGGGQFESFSQGRLPYLVSLADISESRY